MSPHEAISLNGPPAVLMDAPRRILVIQLKRAGDVIVTTPVLPVLRQRFPDAKIGFLVDPAFASLLDNNPNLDQLIRYNRSSVRATWAELRCGGWDWIIDFQSSPRSVLAGLASGARMRSGYQVTFWGRFFTTTVRRPGGRQSVVDGKFTLVEHLIGPVSERPPRRLFLTQHEQAWARQLLAGAKPIGIVPTHRRWTRRWTPEGFTEIAKRFLAQGEAVWLFWGPGEREYVEEIAAAAPGAKLIPPTSFRQMAALLAECKAVITNDNGPMHLAVAAGASTVTMYGPTDPIAWNPGGPRHTALRLEGLSCLGCNLNECPFAHECMRQLSPDVVWTAANRLAAGDAVVTPR
jgi:ADP-heptose:LPS heptosyltransferase